MKIIHIFHIAEDGKGEVDHVVRGVAKAGVRLSVTGGIFIQIVQFLQTKFSYKSNPVYYVQEIDPQGGKTKGTFETLYGRSSFQVTVFIKHSPKVIISSPLSLWRMQSRIRFLQFIHVTQIKNSGSEGICSQVKYCTNWGTKWSKSKWNSQKNSFFLSILHFTISKEMGKVLYCYQSSIVYPFVNWEALKKENIYIIITNAELNCFLRSVFWDTIPMRLTIYKTTI